MKDKYLHIIEHTEGLWDMDQAIPTPLGDWIKCGVCGDTNYVLRNGRWFKRSEEETGYPYRVDVSFKCTNCGYAWVHGLIPRQEVWEKWVTKKGRKGGAKYLRYQLEQEV